jgi:hypothetical protein
VRTEVDTARNAELFQNLRGQQRSTPLGRVTTDIVVVLKTALYFLMQNHASNNRGQR